MGHEHATCIPVIASGNDDTCTDEFACPIA